jgi:hypothetical protein
MTFEELTNTSVKQKIMFNRMNLPREVKKVEAFRGAVGESNLGDVKGIGAATKIKLMEAWITTKEELKELDEIKLKEIITNPLSLKGIIAFKNN